jgi:hypothetical protein
MTGALRPKSRCATVGVLSRPTEAEALQAKVPTEDEARRGAANIAKLPVLLKREE